LLKPGKRNMRGVKIRSYRIKDRPGVRQVCCATGFLGESVSKIFSDDEIFADLFSKYYTDMEPESAFVIEDKGKIVGYVLGCRHIRKFRRYFLIKFLPQIFPKLIWRYFIRYNHQERKWVRRVIFDGLKRIPQGFSKSAHLHINLMKEYRGRGVGKILINKFFQYMREQGVKKVYGGVWSFEDRKTEQLYRKLGFEICARRQSNIFKDTIKKRVYALELMRDLSREEWRIK